MKLIDFKIILTSLILGLMGCENDESKLINYCYLIDDGGKILEVICDNISEEECIKKSTSNNNTEWVFDQSENCPIADPPELE